MVCMEYVLGLGADMANLVGFPSDLEIKAPFAMGRGGEVELGGRRRRGLGSRPNTWVSFPWPREAGLASLIVCRLSSSTSGPRKSGCLPLSSARFEFAQDTEQKLPSHVRHPLRVWGSHHCHASRRESRCLRPTIDFVSLETVEKGTEASKHACPLCAHPWRGACCLQKRQPAAPSENGGRVTAGGVHPTLRHPTILFGLGHLYRYRDPSKPHRRRQS